MQVILRTFLSLFITGLYVNGSSAQYVSGKMIPDKNKTLIRDISDASYLLSTTITAQEMSEHLSIIASDEFQGRETGYPGNRLAADYIANELTKLDLPAIGDEQSYFQQVAFTFSSWETNELTINDKKFKQLWDFLGFPQNSVSKSILTDEVVFAGYGIDITDGYSDYISADVRDKVVMVWDGEPADMEGRSMITGSTELSEWSSDFELKRRAAQDRGAAMLLIISSDIKKVLDANRRLLINRVSQLGDHTNTLADGHTNMTIISSTIAEAILGENRQKVIDLRDEQKKQAKVQEPVIVPCKLSMEQKVKKDLLAGQNVLGYIEGTDKKDELVIVSAHYDHVGMKGDEVFNGADDNGSGTTTVLEIAEALALAKKMNKGPRRSVLCLWMTGEEKGLLGSEYYAENPVFPLEKTMVDVNIDMVGRWGEEYLDQTTPYVYVIGSDRLSKDLHQISETMNATYAGMTLDYKYNDEKDPNRFYYRSDHYNFAKKGIPAIFYFNGVHSDYHRPGDTVDKIDFKLMESRGRLIFNVVWDLANRNKPISLIDGQQ